jgi:hypothetical protein
MLPFLNMRIYNRSNYLALQPFIEKMKNGQLTIENILEEDEIIQDLKTSPNSQFLYMINSETIRKLIDYATKMPVSDDKKVGHRFPFNATELLCCDNSKIIEHLMNEVPFKEEKEEVKKEDEKKEEEKKDEEKKEEQIEEKKEEQKEEKKEEQKEEKKEELDKEKNNKTEKENEKVKSIIINIKGDKFEKSRSKDIDNKTKKKLLNKSKSIRFLSNKMRHSMSKPITNILKTKKSDNINNAYNIMFKGRQFQYPTRVINKDNHDYFKQFFFLLFQSMKMNSNNIGNFLGYNPEILYNECKKEHVPFHKYQKWIERKLLKKEMNENSKKIEDFSTITGIFCSSLI